MNSKLKKLLIKTKKEVFSSQIGNNTSKFKGEGYDFCELREYEDGEDIRKIDWVISAKMQKPYVKVFHIQRELNIVIAPILSGSIHFGTIKLKQELVTQICAILGYSSIANGDSFSSFILNDEVILNTKSTKKLLGVDDMAYLMDSYNCIGKKIDYTAISKGLFSKVKKKSLIFLVGDFFDISSLDLRLLSKKHQVVAVIVRDRFEENPVALGNVNFLDPQSLNSFDGVLDEKTVKNYKAKIKLNDHKLYEHFKKCSIDFVKIYTDEEPIVKLFKLFR